MIAVCIYTTCLTIFMVNVVWRISAQTQLTRYFPEMGTYIDHGFRSLATDTAIECCMKCESTDGCLSVSYKGELGICRLNDGNVTKTNDAGWISFLTYEAPSPPSTTTATTTCTATTSESTTSCHITNGGFCYVVVSVERNWADSECHCQTLGGHLVDMNEHEFLVESDRNMVDLPSFWIGLNGRTDEDTFVWSSSAPYDFEDAVGVTENGEDTDCVAMIDMDGVSSWKAELCSHAFPSVCKLEL